MYDLVLQHISANTPNNGCRCNSGESEVDKPT